MDNQKETLFDTFWYWWYPELRHFETTEELRALKKAFNKRPGQRLPAWLIILGIAVGVGALSPLLILQLMRLGLPWVLAVLVNSVFWGVSVGFITLQLIYWPFVRFTRRYLQDQGVAVCLQCGYDLREPRCSECGEAFDEQLLRPEESAEP